MHRLCKLFFRGGAINTEVDVFLFCIFVCLLIAVNILGAAGIRICNNPSLHESDNLRGILIRNERGLLYCNGYNNMTSFMLSGITGIIFIPLMSDIFPRTSPG